MMRPGIVLASLIVVGCGTTSQGTPPASPAEAAAAPGSSGGTSVDAAEPVTRGQTVTGVVVDDQPRYYRIDLAEGESLELGFYTQISENTGNATITVLDANGGSLKEQMVTVSQTTDWDVNQVEFTAEAAGPYVVRAACYKCLTKQVRYRIAFE